MKRKSQDGFTLVEVMVVTGIMAIVIVLFGSLFFGNWVNYEATLSRVDLQEKTDNFFAVLEEDVMEAENFVIANAGKQLTLTYPADPWFDFSTIVYDFTADGTVVRTTTGIETGTQALIAQGLEASSVFAEDSAVANVLVCQLNLSEQVFGRTVALEDTKRLALRN